MRSEPAPPRPRNRRPAARPVQPFLESFAFAAKLNLHLSVLAGVNDHHKIEAAFKAMARALDAAVRVDPRRGGDIPSTKGTL